MKFIISIFTLTRTMVVLLVIFAVSAALATFIENDFGTETARKLVYSARWFEVLLALGGINIIGVTIKLKMYTRAKLSVLLFHLAFVVILLGAGITRYFGNEGIMHIREGDTKTEWITVETYLSILISNGNEQSLRSYPVLFAQASGNRFRKTQSFGGEKISVRVNNYIPQAQQGLEFSEQGEALIHLVTTKGGSRQEVFLSKGMSLQGNQFMLKFSEENLSPDDENVANVYNRDGQLFFQAPFVVFRTNMANKVTDSLSAFEEHAFFPLQVHEFAGNLLVVKQFIPTARIVALPAEDENQPYPSALDITVSSGEQEHKITVMGKKEQTGQMFYTNFTDAKVGISYGSIKKDLPFALRLNNFLMKRYPGSESPSWYESNVQLFDTKKNIDRDERIYMNHILKHRGYRFYQSSYDMDELGTVLAVNRDGIGSTITYLGYLLMGLGMLLSLLNKKSRFGLLSRITGVKPKNLATLLLGILFLSQNIGAQSNPEKLPEIKAEHAASFGSILVQDNGGRIEPVNTLASEILRKVARKEEYKGQSSDQVILGMVVYPEKWQEEPMIRVNHPQIQKELGIGDKYASFLNFFASDMYGGYVLREFVENAYRKKPAYRSKFDNEIMKVDERLNICYMLYNGSLFKFFPDSNDVENTWYSPIDSEGVFAGEDSLFVQRIMAYYREEVLKSTASGDWKTPDQMVNAIKIFQERYGEDVIPSARKRRAEAFYNSANIFERISRVYFLIGFLLLIVQFIHIFFPGFPLKWFSAPSVVLISLTFILHAYGLGLRWYVSGHAPWSNGYEALTFIAWATVLAGLIYSRKTSITVSTSAVLASLILFTAHLSWMDPQITNLAPVLKSYWLVIHVAMITSSYGFLGLGALVAAFNMLLMFFQTKKNQLRLDVHIAQLTRVIEMTLIVGIYLLSVGTFLGGVWANESWGRYWAWDPKETWALISILIYSVILHLRLIPGLKGKVLFNSLSMWGFWSIIMTYFGVNYYLSGLHSYAAGDPLPIPPVVFYSLGVMAIVTIISIILQYHLHRNPTKSE